MELEIYLQVIKRRIWIIIITPLTTVLIALLLSVYLPWNYSATTKIRVNLNPYSNPSYTEMIYADRIMNTYIEIAKSNAFLSALREKIGLEKDRPAKVEVAIIPETEIITITVEDRNRELATVAANTMATMLIDQNPLRSGKVYVIDPATVPALPSLPDYLKRAVLALVLGGVAGIGLAFLFENLDPRLYSVQQIQEIVPLPIIGEIPARRRRFGKKNQLLNQKPEDADAFRRIYVNLLAKTAGKPLKTILVSSAQPEEGKSAVLSNLACSIANAGFKVIAVDADLRRPRLHAYFELDNKTGITDLLSNDLTLHEVIQDSHVKELRVITSGEKLLMSSDDLPKEAMQRVFTYLKQLCDYVLIDSPASLGVSDTVVLATMVDAVLLVVRPEFVQREALQYSYQHFVDVNANMIGVVLNRVKGAPFKGYSRYYQPQAKPPASAWLANLKGLLRKTSMKLTGLETMTTAGPLQPSPDMTDKNEQPANSAKDGED
jgi:capsular exopolysaccharide synthesis family protein